MASSDHAGSAVLPTRPRVIYIGGLARSGTTLLERGLNQFPGVCSVGELVYLWRRGIVNNERCGCGQAFFDCQFWQSVGQAGFGGWNRVNVNRVLELSGDVDDVKYTPRILGGPTRTRFRAKMLEYLHYFETLYAAISEVSGCEIIVDSSKTTSTAYILRNSERVDLRLVHMVRDARGVAYSCTKKVVRPEVTDAKAFMPTFSPAYVAFLYDGHNALLASLRLLSVPYRRVRYEDFVERPDTVLQDLAEFSGISYDPSMSVGGGTVQLMPSHTVSGNPSRFKSGPVRLHRDDGWRTALPPHHRQVVNAIALPAQLAFGYLWPSRRSHLSGSAPPHDPHHRRS